MSPSSDKSQGKKVYPTLHTVTPANSLAADPSAGSDFSKTESFAQKNHLAFGSLFSRDPIMDLANRKLLIRDRFLVEKLLYETSRTNIFVAKDLQSAQSVFVHVIKNHFFKHGKLVQSWVRSIRKMKTFGSRPGFLEVLDLGIWKGKVVVVTRFFPLIPFNDLFASPRELPLRFVFSLMIALTKVFIEVRNADFGTTLLSREDIFVCRDGDVKIFRFANSRLEDAGEKIEDEGTDLLFLGTTLYELLTGEQPEGKGRISVDSQRTFFQAILNTRKEQQYSYIFPELEELFVRTSRKCAENRMESLGEFLTKLQNLEIWVSSREETDETRRELEELNSAFDVVDALRGKQEDGEKIQYSRVWQAMEKDRFLNVDREIFFRWLAVGAIFFSFFWKLFF